MILRPNTKLQLLLLGIGFFLGGIVILVNGFKASALARRFPAPVAISLPDLIRQHPTEGWYKISGGVLALGRGVTLTKSHSYGRDKHTTAYAPVLMPDDFQAHPIDDPHGAPTYVVAHIKDRESLDLMGRLRAYDDMGNREKMRLFVIANQDKLVNTDAVIGTVHEPDKDGAGALDHLDGIRDHCLIVEVGETPQAGVSSDIARGLLLTLGVPVIGGVLLFLRWRSAQGMSFGNSYGSDGGDGGFTAIYSDGPSVSSVGASAPSPPAPQDQSVMPTSGTPGT